MRDIEVGYQIAQVMQSTYIQRATETYTCAITNGGQRNFYLDALPTNSADWYLFAVIDFGDDVTYRVVDVINTNTGEVGWRTAVNANFSYPSTVTLSSAPLTETVVYRGGGPAVDDLVTAKTVVSGDYVPSGKSKVVVSVAEVKEAPIALGTGYQSYVEDVQGGIAVFYDFPRTEDPNDYPEDQHAFRLLVHQVREVVREGSLLATLGCARIRLPSLKYGYRRLGTGSQSRSGWQSWALMEYQITLPV